VPNFDHEHQVELAKRIEAGDLVARDEMISNNHGLVLAWANKYSKAGLDYDELVAEGTIGLVRAVDKYEWRKGFHFSTYAVWWIMQAMQRAISDNRLIYVPQATADGHRLLSNAKADLANQLGRAPTDAELEDDTGLDASTRHRLDSVPGAPLSLDRLGASNGDDFVMDRRAGSEDPAELVDGWAVTGSVRRAVNRLPEMHRDILSLRFGFDNPALSLEDISKQIHVGMREARERYAEGIAWLADDPELLELMQ